MNVLVIQENGRHESNKDFRECFCLQRAFFKNGIACDIWGLGHPNYLEGVDFDSYNLILNLENYDDEANSWLPDLSQVNNKKFLWSIDAHIRGAHTFENIFDAGNYDLLLHSTKDFITSRHHRWFPNCFDDTLIKPDELIDKQHFLGFCGNIVNRGDMLDFLEMNTGLKKDIFVLGEDMVKAINSYDIHFNYNVSNDINYRNFETIGCRTVLLTDFNEHYEELGFVNSENCIFYNDFSQIPNILELILITIQKLFGDTN